MKVNKKNNDYQMFWGYCRVMCGHTFFIQLIFKLVIYTYIGTFSQGDPFKIPVTNE